MITKSFTYNLVVSNSSEAINRLFFDSKTSETDFSSRRRLLTFSKIQELGKYAEDLIVTPFNNDEFLGFETQLNTGGGVPFTTLRLQESSRVLEKFIIPTNGIDEQMIARFKKKVRDLKKLNSDLLEQLRAIRPRYYISFGVGYDISKWAGPFCVDLIDANLSITEDGIRQIELGFTPTQETLKVFTNKVFFDKDITQGRNTFDTANTTARQLEIKSSEVFETDDLGTRLAKTIAEQNETGDRWNYAIRKLIRRYISDRFESVPQGNVLVLLPYNFDEPAGDRRDSALINVPTKGTLSGRKDIISLYRSKLAGYGIDISRIDAPTDPELVTSRLTEKSEIYNRKLNERLANSPNEEDKEKLRKRKAIVAGLSREQTRLRELAAEGNPYAAMGATYPKNAEVERRNSEPVNADYKVSSDEKPPMDSVKLSLVSDIKLDSADGNILEMLKPIYTFVRKLKGNLKSDDFEPVAFEENNLQITKRLAKSGLIEDGDSSIIVFGNLSTIQKLLYGNGRNLISNNLKSTFSYADDPEEIEEFWTEYLTSYREFANGRDQDGALTSSFEEEIDLGPFANLPIANITDDSLVFMHNLKNSNVLDINFDSSPYKAQLLNFANESTYRLIDEAFDFQTSQEVFNNSLDIDIVQYVAHKLPDEERERGKISPQRIFDVVKGDTTFYKLIKETDASSIRVVDFLDLVLFKFLATSSTSTGNIPEGNGVTLKIPPGIKGKSDAEVIKRINQHLLKVDIKTLPFFNTSYYINRPCVLVGSPNRVVGSKLFEDRNPVPAIYTNKYRIFSYRHVLTADDAYSEFTLYPDGMTPTGNLNLTLGEYFFEELEKLKDEKVIPGNAPVLGSGSTNPVKARLGGRGAGR